MILVSVSRSSFSEGRNNAIAKIRELYRLLQSPIKGWPVHIRADSLLNVT